MLDKQQWLDRHRNHDLPYDDVTLDDVDIRTHGDAAVAIGQWTQRGAHQGYPNDGTFRVTQILVRDNDDWSVSGLHLRPISRARTGPGTKAGISRREARCASQ